MFALTERLLLWPAWPEDADTLYRAIADESIVRNLAKVPWPYTPSDAEYFASMQAEDHYPSALLWLRTGAAPVFVGTCGLAEHEGEPELGYWIARKHWGQGYATEAAKAMVGAAKALGHKRLVSGHFTDNPASGRVLRKTGFKPTGQIARRYSVARGQEVPCALFALHLDEGEGGSDGNADMVMPAAPMAWMAGPTRQAA